MANRTYYDKNGKPDSLPTGQENGKLYRTLKYIDRENVCPECGGHVFYTKNNVCLKCAMLRACDLYSYVTGRMGIERGVDGFSTSYTPVNGFAPVGNRLITEEYRDELNAVAGLLDISAPVSIEESVRNGVDLWVTGDPCSKAGHYGIKTLENKCYFCELDRNRPKPRQEAIAAGKTWYRPLEPCGKCGKTAERNVHTGQCRGCLPAGTETNDKRQSPDSKMMKDNPDMIISRADAIEWGFKVYRTGKPCNKGHNGFRYVSTNGCIDCLRGR